MDAKQGDTTLDLDLNWTNNDVHGLDIEDAALPLSDEILIPSTPNRVVRWLSSHPRLWLVTCTIIPLLLALVGVTYRVEVDLGLSSFQVRDHISYRALESYIAAVKLHRTLLLNMASTYMSDYHSPSHDLHESTRHVRSVNAGRYEKLWTFHIIFSLNEQSTQVNATIFSAGHVLYMHHVIQQLTAIPEYTAACWLRGDTCHSPGSLLSELMDGDVLRADWSVRLAALREKGVFWYTDEHFPETGRSTMTRVELYLGGPLYGYESKTDRASEQYDTLLPVVVTLRNTLRHVTSDAPIDVHWGGDAITGYEIRETVFGDAQYALGSLLLVAVLVFVQLRSPFLAMYAVYELLIAFPAVYGVYMYACQLESVNLLTGVALFLVIGIGVDDVFVFYFSYQHARTHYPDAPAHRLAYTYQHAMLATFVTSLTTAAAFLANLFSQIPALRMFGIYMSLIVMMNWLLSVTLFPAALVTWDSHVRAKEQKIVRCLAPCLKRKKSFKRNNFNQKLGQCLSSHVYTLRYLYLASFAVLTAGAVYQSLSLEGASTPPQVFQHNSNLGWFSEWQRSGWIPDMTGATSWTPSKPANHTTTPPATPHAPHTMTPVTHTSAPVMRTPTGVVTPVTQRTPHTAPTASDSSDSEPPVPPSINNIDVQIVWGLTGHVNGSHVNPRDPFSEWIGIPERDLQFDPLTTACIDHLANVCDTLMQRGLLASPGRCLLSAFKDKLTAAGKWPLNDRNAMLYHLLLFIRTNIEEYQSDFSLNHFNWTDIKTRLALQQPLDLQVIWLRYAFRSNTSRSISSRDAVALYNEWQSVLDELDRSAPRECRGALQFSDTWIEALTETTLVDNIVSSLFTSLVVALGTLLLFVGNVLTAFLALVTLAVNLFLTLGAFKLLGWTLGAVESLCMTLLVGLSVDYVLHLAHAYTQAARRAPLQSRQVLLSTAIQSLGTAILSGAITTIASTAMLLMCQIVIFIKFGAIICLTLLTALLLTTLLFPALVLVFGPRSGDSCDMYVLCRTMMRCGRSALTQNDFALLQHDEQHALMNHVDATY